MTGGDRGTIEVKSGLAVSFNWTTPAIRIFATEPEVAKNVTRREWNLDYARRFRAGVRFYALDRQYRYKGRRIAICEMTRDAYQESTASLPAEDWIGEGFEYLQRIGAKVGKMPPRVLWRAWQMKPSVLTVVRFRILELIEADAPPAIPAQEGLFDE